MKPANWPTGQLANWVLARETAPLFGLHATAHNGVWPARQLAG